jgi:hypothetical protein
LDFSFGAFPVSPRDYRGLKVSAMAESPRDTYNYTPIQDLESIRLLSLGPGRKGDPLVGNLTVAHLGQVAKHKALSYVWGDPTPSASFICDGKLLPITPSLEEALQAIRQSTETLTIWIDQICINQQDLAERSQQIRFMQKIFSTSETVLVWIGRDDFRIAEKAFNLLGALQYQFSEPELVAQFTRMQHEDVQQFETEDWFALARFYGRPWVGVFPRIAILSVVR